MRPSCPEITNPLSCLLRAGSGAPSSGCGLAHKITNTKKNEPQLPALDGLQWLRQDLKVAFGQGSFPQAGCRFSMIWMYFSMYTPCEFPENLTPAHSRIAGRRRDARERRSSVPPAFTRRITEKKGGETAMAPGLKTQTTAFSRDVLGRY